MRLLLDTHAFIWWDNDPSRLSQPVLDLCQDQANTLILSVVSIWEIQIKSQLQRLTLTLFLADLISKQVQVNQIEVLPITLEHVLALEALPFHHKDPFDRLLIAQALSEKATLVSKDVEFASYPVQLIW
ncbi:MAG: type II toxin-antitoxin system VapC family toxin [Anaerolineae bacterium]|nr:type II toxin-antitoxin system VapC family toxin [Anaerolineae bacterium]MCO5204342.1 type II toxin-antitoxin system VapC family toxin [Anaerolineae bacterium]